MAAYISPHATDIQSRENDHPTVTGSTNTVLYAKRDLMSTMPADEAARLLEPRLNSKRPLTSATVTKATKQKPQLKPKSMSKSAGMKAFNRDHPSPELPADIETTEANSWLACMAAFERDHPDAELPAEQQRLADWADELPPPAKKPATARRRLQELDAKNLNTSPRDQNFANDALRTSAKANATPGTAPRASTYSASTAQSPAEYPSWAYKLKTPLPLPSDIPATTPNSPPSPSPRPKVAGSTSASRTRTSISTIGSNKRPSPLAPKCMHRLRLISQGECVACTRDAIVCSPEEDNRKPNPTALQCQRYPECRQVPGKCYWCAYLVLAAKRDASGESELRGKSGRIVMKARRAMEEARREAE